MRWTWALPLLVACGGNGPQGGGSAQIVIDIPNGPLDPKGFTDLDVVLHESGGDVSRSAKLGPNMTFDLGDLEPDSAVWVEASLRNESGAVVGYGRTALPAPFGKNAEIDVPVRRPIVYIAGLVSMAVGQPPPPPTPPTLSWSEAPATVSDLSLGGALDGSSQLSEQAVLMIDAGPSLFMVEQQVSSSTGALTGNATIKPVSMADHKLGAALSGTMTGGVIDGAGTDDGNTLVIGTTTNLFGVDTTMGTVRSLATGEFDRVAVMFDNGETDAVAIKNRVSTSGACGTTAELWWVPLSGEVGTAKMIATGGFADVATDRGHAYYVDDCKGELGEVTASGIKTLRTGLAKPTALAVSNGQAYIGLESSAPAATSLLVASVSSNDPPRSLWNEAATQVLNAPNYPGVQRELDAQTVAINQLEVGAGGDYVAITTAAQFHGARISAANFPEMIISTEELRVFDASTGGVLQRYRSWCDGVYYVEQFSDIDLWACATTAGQSEPARDTYDHHINSMTFLYGKK